MDLDGRGSEHVPAVFGRTGVGGGLPVAAGEPENIVSYMRSTNQVPIMTNSESILQFGNNAYGKPAAALNILRETILGRELFDFAFKEYARRWRFKRPFPADFFRTMEDASAVDLDWFFRGWFYTTDHTDLGIRTVRRLTVDTRNPDVEKPRQKRERAERGKNLSDQRNEALAKRDEAFPELKDFYSAFDEFDVTEWDRNKYQKLLKGLDDDQKKLLETQRNFYVVELENIGGLVMPVILQVDYRDGSQEVLRIPAEIWRLNHRQVFKAADYLEGNQILDVGSPPRNGRHGSGEQPLSAPHHRIAFSAVQAEEGEERNAEGA